MFIFWGAEQICFYNDAYRPSLGDNGKHPAIGKRGKEVWPDIWPVINPLIDDVLYHGLSTWSEDQLIPIFRNGHMEDVYWTFSYSPIKGKTGDVEGVLVICSETTEKVKSLHTLKVSDQRFQNLVRDATIGIIALTGEEMRVDIVNEFYAQLVNRARNELLNQPLFSIIPEAEEVFSPILEKVRITGEPLFLYEQPYFVHVNGNRKEGYLDVVYQPYKENDGTTAGVMVLCYDVTRQVVAKERIEKSEQKFRRLIEESPIPMCLYTGLDMKIEVINDELLKVWGKDKSVIGKNLKDVLPELESQPYLALLQDVYIKGIPQAFKNAPSYVVKDGIDTTFYFDLWYKPVFDADGKVYGVVASGTDVTEKVIAQKKTEESEFRFRSMVQNATVAIALTRGTDMIFESINEPMMQLIGRYDNIIGNPLLQVLPELAGQQVKDLLDNVFKNVEAFQGNEIPATLLINGKSEDRFYNISYIPLYENDAVNYILHIAIDVTQQVTSRKKVEEAEESARLAIESAELGTYKICLVTDDMDTSERFNTIWGSPNCKLPRSEFVSYIHPDDRATRTEAHNQSLITGKLHYEARLVHKDESLHWVRVNGRVQYDEAGQANCLIGVIQDITEHKSLQQQKDNFIAMASHELKTPVTSIKAMMQIVELMLLDRGAAKEAEMVRRMDTQLNRLTKLISDLLNITRLNLGKLEYHRSSFNFNDLVAEMVSDLQLTTQQHTIDCKLSKPAQVFADRERIGQVLTNFLSNAIKYSPDANTIYVFTEINNNDVILCVQDFGIGLQANEKDKVFEQFYRANSKTHQTFQGLGLGLFISSEIIKRENGKIWVNSTTDEGATFCFSLPLV